MGSLLKGNVNELRVRLRLTIYRHVKNLYTINKLFDSNTLEKEELDRSFIYIYIHSIYDI